MTSDLRSYHDRVYEEQAPNPHRNLHTALKRRSDSGNPRACGAHQCWIAATKFNTFVTSSIENRRVADLKPSDINRLSPTSAPGNVPGAKQVQEARKVDRRKAVWAKQRKQLGFLPVEQGIVKKNPVHRIREPANRVTDWRLTFRKMPTSCLEPRTAPC